MPGTTLFVPASGGNGFDRYQATPAAPGGPAVALTASILDDDELQPQAGAAETPAGFRAPDERADDVDLTGYPAGVAHGRTPPSGAARDADAAEPCWRRCCALLDGLRCR